MGSNLNRRTRGFDTEQTDYSRDWRVCNVAASLKLCLLMFFVVIAFIIIVFIVVGLVVVILNHRLFFGYFYY